VQCSACRADVPITARFCPSCGHDLHLRGDERRVVTVVFADIVGFTTMSESRDPEQMKNIVERCFERLVVDIEAFGGRVDKIVGDAILALFGAPVAHEDDAERAVRAALHMQQTIDRTQGELGVEVRLRVGVNTGEVLVGALRAGGDYTAMGDVVNTASRLQTLAEPGQVVVGPSTHAATQRVMRYRSLGEVTARGREALVAAWVAEEAVLPPGHRPDRHRVPLVGRDAEVALLRNAVTSSITHQRAALLLVVGEAGVGKSRLVEELAVAVEEDHAALVLEGRCVPYGEANVWWPIADALRNGCDIRPSHSDEEARRLALESVRDSLGTSASEAEVARVLAGLLHLMGYDSPLRGIDAGRAREEATAALITFADRYSRRRPVMVALSDLHWADDLVLDMLDTLVARLCDRSLVLVATARRSLEERWVPPRGRHNLVMLSLDPLQAEAAADLLQSLAGTDLPDDLVKMLLDRSGGNPLFLEELVGLLADPEVVAAPAARVSLADAGPSDVVDLPDTLRGLVAARLDGLPPQERRVLEDCAVLGRRGPVRAIEVMVDQYRGMDEVGPVLDSLVARELLELHGDQGGQRWAFRSDLVREVAYGMLTRADRALAHAGIAAWMEVHESTDQDAVVDRIAHHYSRAAELSRDLGTLDRVPHDVADRALVWLERAAARADETEVPVVAARLYGEGLALLPEDAEPRRVRFLLGRARALAMLRQLDRARADARAALERATDAGDHPGVARALLTLADIEQKSGQWEAADTLLEEAHSRFVQQGDASCEAQALRLRGFGALFRHDYDRATELLEGAYARFEALGDQRGAAWALQNLAWCAFYAGRPHEAETRLHTAAEMFSATGDHGGLGWARGLLAYTRFILGHRAEADAMAEEVLDHVRAGADDWGLGMMLVLQAAVRLWEGRTSEAVDRASEAVSVFERIDDPYGRLQAAGVLGRALTSAGRTDEARARLDLLREQAAAAPSARERIFNGLGVANSANALGDVELAAGVLDEVQLHAGGDTSADRELVTSLALHLAQRGDLRRARQVLDERCSSEIERGGGNATAVAALVHAAVGEAAEALAAADRVDSDERSTYLDRAVAGAARALAHSIAGRAEESVAALEQAAATVDATEDLLGQAVVRLAAASVAAAGGPPLAGVVAADAEERLAALGIRAEGWRRLFDLAVRAEVGSVAP
jgi:class 3 adenylate cyclase/tetratricopeptide (TPR) repeat protein